MASNRAPPSLPPLPLAFTRRQASSPMSNFIRRALVPAVLVASLLFYVYRPGAVPPSLSNQTFPFSSLRAPSNEVDSLHPPQLKFEPGVPKSPGSTYTQTLVVSSTSNEDVRWTENILPDLQVAVYRADDPLAPYHPPVNKGHEAMMMLTYIIDHYYNLSDTTIFIHAHQEAWHNNDVFDLDMIRTLRALSNEHVARVGFFNLRCHSESGCPDGWHPHTMEVDPGKTEEIFVKDIWEDLHGPDAPPLPEVIGAMCCSQFAVSRDRLLAVPLERWHHYRNWLLDTPLENSISGRIWEFTWHIILTGEMVLCPTMNVCYCDGFGVCFRDQGEIDALLAMREVVFLAEERKAEYINEGKSFESVDWHISQKMQRVVDQRLHEAILRGQDPKTRAELSNRPWKDGDGF